MGERQQVRDRSDLKYGRTRAQEVQLSAGFGPRLGQAGREASEKIKNTFET